MAVDVRTNRLILFATSIGAVLSPLIGSMIVLAMPEIGVAFGVVARDLGWLSTIFILANAIFLIPAARLSYLLGYKRSYLLGAVVVAVSCALSVVAPTYGVLLGLRVVAACGTSFLMVTGLAILSRVYPPRGRGTAFGVHAAVPMWRFFRDEVRGRSEGRFDVVGTVLYAAGMFCTMYGLSTLPVLGSAGLTVAGLGVMVVFVWYELRVFSPVLRVRLFFTNRRFARSAYAALLNYGCTAGSVFFVSLYLQSIGQLSPVHAGMVIFFQPLIQAVMTPVAGRVSDRVDPRYIVTGGMLLSTGIFFLPCVLSKTNDKDSPIQFPEQYLRNHFIAEQGLYGEGLRYRQNYMQAAPTTRVSCENFLRILLFRSKLLRLRQVRHSGGLPGSRSAGLPDG